jgi:hypothetical protein
MPERRNTIIVGMGPKLQEKYPQDQGSFETREEMPKDEDV